VRQGAHRAGVFELAKSKLLAGLHGVAALQLALQLDHSPLWRAFLAVARQWDDCERRKAWYVCGSLHPDNISRLNLVMCSLSPREAEPSLYGLDVNDVRMLF